MAILLTLRGPDVGQSNTLSEPQTTLGRQADCSICLPSKQVSRQHARIVRQGGSYLLEDLGSSNGTFVNEKRLMPMVPMPLTEMDTVQIGPYLFALRESASTLVPPPREPPLVVRETLSATSLRNLFESDPARKLEVVLDLSQHLATTLELDPLLTRLLENIMTLFPQADRSMVILCEGERLVVRAHRERLNKPPSFAFSRTIVRKALDEAVGLISDDVQRDQRFQSSATITALDLHSVLCVPILAMGQRPLGVIQVERTCRGYGFRGADLQLMTTIALQVGVVLQFAAMHAEKLREERLLQELALAREIQQSYLPEELTEFPHADFEIYGQVFPARQVAGDFYDFFKMPSGDLAFSIGDVSGKGMPAALFLVAVRTLARHLGKEALTPAQRLAKLNAELSVDNPTCMFVTMVHGTYHPPTGEVVLTTAGHPPPLLRRADGTLEPLALRPGRLLGFDPDVKLSETRLTLRPGDLLAVVTDGFLEANCPEQHTMFGPERLQELVQAFSPDRALADCAAQAKCVIDRFADRKDQKDDQTLLLLRRKATQV